MTGTPISLSRGIRAAGCGSWTITTSPAIHELRKFRSARRKCVLVLLALGIAEIATVAGHRVQVVVNPLGHREERVAAGGHQPTRINTGPVGIRQQRDQHLSDAPAASSRVHIPHHATLEQPTGALRRRAHGLVTVSGKHRFETLKAEAADRDRLEHAHAPILAQRLEAYATAGSAATTVPSRLRPAVDPLGVGRTW